jgi:hypothetical protein
MQQLVTISCIVDSHGQMNLAKFKDSCGSLSAVGHMPANQGTIHPAALNLP